MAVLTGPDPGDDRATRDAHRAAVGWLAEIARLRRSAPIHLACCPRPKAEVVAGQVGDTRESASAIPIRSAVHRLSSVAGGRTPLRDRSGGTGSEPPGVPVTPWWQNTELRDQYEIESVEFISSPRA